MSDTWIVEPHDTLMVRDSRPVGDGQAMYSVAFPWPSSVAGLARTRIGSDTTGRFTMEGDQAKSLLEVSVAGPWLVDLNADKTEPFVPAPADCVWHPGETELQLRRLQLAPEGIRHGEQVDLPDGLHPLLISHPIDGKPAKNAPAFWRWVDMVEWLKAPVPSSTHDVSFGHPALTRETRTHVAIGTETGTAKDGMLFSTEALRFFGAKRRLALAFRCADSRLRSGGVHLGGERRISTLRPATSAATLKRPASLKGTRRLRIVLLTPALFEAGWRPKAFNDATLVAAAVGRPQVISGWDFVARGPKPCRRMAPAGSVYWVDLNPGIDPDAWIDAHWMTCLSDTPQDRRDGFGLCVIGVGS